MRVYIFVVGGGGVVGVVVLVVVVVVVAVVVVAVRLLLNPRIFCFRLRFGFRLRRCCSTARHMFAPVPLVKCFW